MNFLKNIWKALGRILEEILGGALRSFFFLELIRISGVTFYGIPEGILGGTPVEEFFEKLFEECLRKICQKILGAIRNDYVRSVVNPTLEESL